MDNKSHTIFCSQYHHKQYIILYGLILTCFMHNHFMSRNIFDLISVIAKCNITKSLPLLTHINHDNWLNLVNLSAAQFPFSVRKKELLGGQRSPQNLLASQKAGPCSLVRPLAVQKNLGRPLAT